VRVGLGTPDFSLRFNHDQLDLGLGLATNGDWTPFEIAGEIASKKIGGAKIEVTDELSPPNIVAEKKVTVFSFDQAQILVKQGGEYGVDIGGVYGPYTSTATAFFSAKARLRPKDLDCNAQQIAFLRIGIMQERSGFLATTTWTTPTIVWGPFLAAQRLLFRTRYARNVPSSQMGCL
jgi:hypothetical protein